MSSFDDYFDGLNPGAVEDPPSCTFENCRFGAFSKSGKAIDVRFEDGARRWVPVGQIVGDLPEPDSSGTLEVSEWMAKKWDEEGEDPRNRLVRCEGVTVMRESQKALLIRQGLQGEEVWVAKSHVDEGSEVKNDGDSGTLVIPNWIAEEKSLEVAGWGMKTSPRAAAASRVSEDARRRPAPRQQEIPKTKTWAPPPPGDDDDVPF